MKDVWQHKSYLSFSVKGLPDSEQARALVPRRSSGLLHCALLSCRDNPGYCLCWQGLFPYNRGATPRRLCETPSCWLSSPLSRNLRLINWAVKITFIYCFSVWDSLWKGVGWIQWPSENSLWSVLVRWWSAPVVCLLWWNCQVRFCLLEEEIKKANQVFNEEVAPLGGASTPCSKWLPMSLCYQWHSMFWASVWLLFKEYTFFRLLTGAGNPWKCLDSNMVFSRFEKCLNFQQSAWNGLNFYCIIFIRNLYLME